MRGWCSRSRVVVIARTRAPCDTGAHHHCPRPVRYAVVDFATVYLAGSKYRMVQVRGNSEGRMTRSRSSTRLARTCNVVDLHRASNDLWRDVGSSTVQLADPYGRTRVSMQQHTWSPSAQIWDTPRGVAMKHLLGGYDSFLG